MNVTILALVTFTHASGLILRFLHHAEILRLKLHFLLFLKHHFSENNLVLTHFAKVDFSYSTHGDKYLEKC